MSDLGLIRDGSVLVDGETIVQVGSTRRIENLAGARRARVVDLGGKVLLPGFVDPYQRLTFSGPPLKSFEQQIAGVPATAELVSEADAALKISSLKELRTLARRWMYLSAAYGSTTIEICSGQALHAKAELKALRVARLLDGDPVEISAAWNATLPVRTSQIEGVERTLAILDRLEARPGLCRAVEVVCGAEGFRPSSARAILRRAEQLGLQQRLSVKSAEPGGETDLASNLGPGSTVRIESASESDIDRLADSEVVALLSPAVAYHQGNQCPPGRQLIDRGAAVALATGFTAATSPGFGMQTSIALACRQMRMMPEEAIAAATLNAAEALGWGDRLGSIEPDKQADMAVFDVDDYREIPYYFGVNLCSMTMKKGRIIYRAGSPPPLGTNSDRRREQQESRA